VTKEWVKKGLQKFPILPAHRSAEGNTLIAGERKAANNLKAGRHTFCFFCVILKTHFLKILNPSKNNLLYSSFTGYLCFIGNTQLKNKYE